LGIQVRIGFVLGKNGGALDPLAKLTRCFLGGTVGKGSQYISWLHEDDLNRLILDCIEDEKYQGIYNATCPKPVSNREFMKQLRTALKRPWSPPVPSWAVKIGARYIMQTEADLALTGRRCIPKRLSDEHDFKFKYNNLDTSLENIFG
jgi:uncharacterized protein (TIGR01777 family)